MNLRGMPIKDARGYITFELTQDEHAVKIFDDENHEESSYSAPYFVRAPSSASQATPRLSGDDWGKLQQTAWDKFQADHPSYTLLMKLLPFRRRFKDRLLLEPCPRRKTPCQVNSKYELVLFQLSKCVQSNCSLIQMTVF